MVAHWHTMPEVAGSNPARSLSSRAADQTRPGQAEWMTGWSRGPDGVEWSGAEDRMEWSGPDDQKEQNS